MRKAVLLCCTLAVLGVRGYCQETSAPPEADFLECAHRVALSIPSRAQRIGALCQVTRGLAESGRSQEAEECFAQAVESAEELVYTDHIWADVLMMFSGAGQHDYAVKVARLLKEHRMRHQVLPGILDTLADTGSFDGAREVAAILLASAREEPDPQARFGTLVAAGKACAKIGDAEAANWSFREAVRIAVEEGAVVGPETSIEETFQDYAKSCAYEHIRDSIEEFLEPALRPRALMAVGATLRERDEEESADRAFADAAEATRLIENLDERVGGLAILAQRYAEQGRPELARQLRDEALAAINEVGDADYRDDAWKSIARCYAELGQHKEALEAAYKIQQAYDLSDALVEVSLVLARTGQLQEALRQMRKAPDEFVVEKGIGRLAKVYVEAGQYEDGVALATKMARLRATALTGISRFLSAKGDYERAVRTAELLPSGAGGTDTVAVEIADECLEKATQHNLSHNLSMALKALNLMGFPFRQWGPLVRVADKYEEAGQLDEALRVLEQAEKTAKQIENEFESARTTALTLARKARLHAAAGQGDRARKAVNKIGNILVELGPRDQRMALEGIMHEMVDRGDLFALASGLLDSVEDATARTMALWHLADRYAAFGAAGPAREALHRGIELVKRVEGADMQVFLLVRGAGAARERGIRVDEAHAEVLRRVAESAEAYAREEALRTAERVAAAATGKAALAFFTQTGCASCREAGPIVEQFKREMPDVEVRRYDIHDAKHARLLGALGDITEMPADKAGLVPSVFSSEKGLVGKDITLPGLKELAMSSRGLPLPWDVAREQGKWVPALGFLAVVGGGLIDGVNPCAFTVLIFFMAYLGALGKNKKEIAVAGLLFTAAVFVTYFAIGLGLRSALKLGEERVVGLGSVLQVLIAAFVLALAVLSVWDGVLCLKGRARESRLRLPQGLQSRIRRAISRRARLGLTVGATLVLGLVVALLEFPCTGMIYPPIIAMLDSPAFRARGVGLLVLYNLCFIAPLIVVFVGVFFGLTSERLTALFQKHMAKVKFALAGVFLLMFAFMLLWIGGAIPARF